MIDKNYLVESKVIPINVNVSDDKVLPYMYPAFEQLRATLPIALYTALDALAEEDVKQWSVTNSYVATNKANQTEVGVLKMWQSVGTNSDSKPTTANTADWLELELGTFLVNYVQPFLAHATFYGYSINSGVNVSHQGLQQISNETAQPVTGNNLQAFLNYWKNQKDLKRRSMLNYLDDKSNLLDGVTYTAVEASKKKTSFQIRGIGRTVGNDTSRIIDYGSTY
jgi:hypothetical protein